MHHFRSAKQSMRLMDVLPPEQGERLRQPLKPAFSPEVVDAEFEIVSGNADHRRYPTFNDNRSSGQPKHLSSLPRMAYVLVRSVRRMEGLLQSVSGRSFAALTFGIFACVFIAIQILSQSATGTALAAPSGGPLVIEHVDLSLKVRNGLPMLMLSGEITNRTQANTPVPDLTITMADGTAGGNSLTMEPPVKSLAPGQSAFFEGQFRHAGGKLPKLTVDFAQAGRS